jgi:hypothetical protein
VALFFSGKQPKKGEKKEDLPFPSQKPGNDSSDRESSPHLSRYPASFFFFLSEHDSYQVEEAKDVSRRVVESTGYFEYARERRRSSKPGHTEHNIPQKGFVHPFSNPENELFDVMSMY